jgi:hypothetical protein
MAATFRVVLAFMPSSKSDFYASESAPSDDSGVDYKF